MVTKSEPICESYTETKLKITGMDNFIKYLIIIVNTVIRMVVIIIINKVGCSTESQQMKYITDSVFLCIFFNTGFLLMLVNANLEMQGYLVAKHFKGGISDFDQNWFTNMGDTIVAAMVFNVWFPIVMEIINYGIRSAMRLKDYLGREDGFNTKTASI